MVLYTTTTKVMKVKCRVMKTNEAFELEVNDDTKCSELIGQVAKQINEDPSAIKLIVGGRILVPNATMVESKIADGTALNVMVKKIQVVATTNETEQKPQSIVQPPVPSSVIQSAAALPPSVKKETDETGWFLPEQKTGQAATQQAPKAAPQDDMPKSYLESIGAAKKAQPSPMPQELAMQPKAQRQPEPQQQDRPQTQTISMQQFAQMLADMTDEQFAASLQVPQTRAVIMQMIGQENAFLLNKPDLLRATLLSEIFGSLGEQAGQQEGSDEGEHDEGEGPADAQNQPPVPAAPQNDAPAPQVQNALEHLRQKWANELATIKAMGIQADDATILQLLEVYGGNLDFVINALFDSQ